MWDLTLHHMGQIAMEVHYLKRELFLKLWWLIAGKFSIKKHQTLTFLNLSWDVDPRNIRFDTIIVFMELMELMEHMEFIDGIHGIYQWNLWNLWLHNGIKPYISGVLVPRRVQKCKSLMLFFWKLARNKLSKLQKKYHFFR